MKASPVWTRMIPYLGEGIAGYELVNGKDVFTGDKLTTGDKVVDGLSLATGGISRVAGKGGAVKAAEIGDGVNKAEITAEDISFSDKFSKPQYKNQVSNRGWTKESIADTINNPYKTGTTTNKYTGNSVTLYYSDDVHYVAVDNGTGKVIQIADLNKADWKMDLTK